MTSRGDSTKLWFEKRRCWTPCILRQVSVCIFYFPAWARVFLLQWSKRAFVWSPSHLLQFPEETWHQMKTISQCLECWRETNNNITSGISLQPKKCRWMFLDLMLNETNGQKKEKCTKTERNKRVSETQRKEHKSKEDDKKIEGKK